MPMNIHGVSYHAPNTVLHASGRIFYLILSTVSEAGALLPLFAR